MMKDFMIESNVVFELVLVEFCGLVDDFWVIRNMLKETVVEYLI